MPSKVKKIKMKTRRAAAKRFQKSTATGKIIRGIQGHGHFLSKMGQKARSLQGTTYVSNDDFARVDRMLPYFGAKRKRTKALNAAIAALKRAVTGTAKASK